MEQQYLKLLRNILDNGTVKPAARENMPGTRSLFGYQMRHSLKDGFPLLTTKRLSFKNIVVELLWFLKGDTNIKYLVDNRCNIWNEDAYNYYVKLINQMSRESGSSIPYTPIPFDDFIDWVKKGQIEPTSQWLINKGYKYGDCGYQYGKVWREWNGSTEFEEIQGCGLTAKYDPELIDQIKNLIEGLRNNPESRRHIVTAIDPAHQDDLALFWCHCLVQFNCRPLTSEDQKNWQLNNVGMRIPINKEEWSLIPKYYLDCQMYQRSADVFLGVPYNIASYALLTHILAKICNMIPGEFIHTFGDVHIYDNHIEQVEQQLSREPYPLPKLKIADDFIGGVLDQMWIEQGTDSFFKPLSEHYEDIFSLENYNSYSAIKAKLSTGLK